MNCPVFHLSPLTSFHHIGYPRYYRDILGLVPFLTIPLPPRVCFIIGTVINPHFLYLDRVTPCDTLPIIHGILSVAS